MRQNWGLNIEDEIAVNPFELERSDLTYYMVLLAVVGAPHSQSSLNTNNGGNYLKAGHDLQDFPEDFPSVKKEHAIEVIESEIKTNGNF